MRAKPCATPAAVIDAVSRNADVALVPMVTVAPGATFNTAPLPPLMSLRSVPSGAKSSTPI
jgi:hypothetical protein